MARSEDKTNFWGEKYTQHYDDNGDKAGTSVEKSDFWGSRYEQHRDDAGNKNGRSEDKSDFWGDSYTQHTTEGGGKSGRSVEKTDVWNDEYTQHYDQGGGKVGWSEKQVDFWGNKSTRHFPEPGRRNMPPHASRPDQISGAAPAHSVPGSADSRSPSSGVWLLVGIAAVTLVGWLLRHGSYSPSAGQTAAVVSDVTPTAPVPHFREGSSYSRVRAGLAKAGWTPAPLAPPGSCGWDSDQCPKVPEVVDCGVGASAACRYAWRKGNVTIEVIGHGEGSPQAYAGYVSCRSITKDPRFTSAWNCNGERQAARSGG